MFGCSGRWAVTGSHHLLVVWVEGLLNQRKLLSTKFPVSVDKLGKLDMQKEKRLDIIRKSFYRAVFDK